MARELTLTLMLAFSASAAVAGECPIGEKQAFQCTVSSGKVVQVCATANGATYAFGRPGAPELTLRSPAAKPYVQRSQGSQADDLRIAFHNGETRYLIEYSAWLDGGATVEEGKLTVSNGARVLATLPCTEGSVEADVHALSIEERPWD